MNQFLREWDKKISKSKRIEMMSLFIETFDTCSGTDIEEELGNGAVLIMLRFLAFLRLTHCLEGYALETQFRALSVFLDSPGGGHFVTEFIDAGGVGTLLDVLDNCITTVRCALLLPCPLCGRIVSRVLCFFFQTSRLQCLHLLLRTVENGGSACRDLIVSLHGLLVVLPPLMVEALFLHLLLFTTRSGLPIACHSVTLCTDTSIHEAMSAFLLELAGMVWSHTLSLSFCCCF